MRNAVGGAPNKERMEACYSCGSQLTEETASVEHVIPNACGGRLTSKRLLCRTCNLSFGKSCDAALAEQANHLVNLLMISRQRGSSKPIRGKVLSGKEFDLQPDGSPRRVRPTIRRSIDGNRTVFSITATDERHFRQAIQGLKRNFPMLDVDEALRAARRTEGYLGEALSVGTSIGGKDVFRAIAKIALNYFVHIGGDVANITSPIVAYVKGATDLDAVWFHCPEHALYAPDPEEVSHVLRVISDPAQGILYAYVELFNCHNYLVRLDGQGYEGPPLDASYAFDLIKRRSLAKSPRLGLNKEELRILFDHKDARPFKVASRLLDRTARIASDRQRAAEIKRMVQRVARKIEQDAKEDPKISSNKVVEYLAGEIARYWLAHGADLSDDPTRS